MDDKEIKKIKSSLYNLYTLLEQEVGSSTMDIVSEIIELEVKLEKLSNR